MNLQQIRRRAWLFAALLTIFIITGLLISPARFQPAATETFPEEALVTDVIDGDTVVLSTGRKVRYLGINAPEVRVRQGTTWVYRPQPFSKEATDCNRDLVLGKWVHLEYDTRKKDDYGRILAYLRQGDLLVNTELVKRGLALVDIRKPDYRYHTSLLAAQEDARNRGEGVWSVLFNFPIEADEAAQHIGELAMVYGQITGIRSSRNRLVIIFGQKEQKRFSAILYREHLRNFPFPAQDLDNFLRSKRANVYGFIKDINGPAIVLCSPTQIDLLE